VSIADDVRAAWWATRSIRRARHTRLGTGGWPRLPEVPSLPPSASRGVSAALRVLRANCLDRAIVFQAWHLALGEERALVIGVTAPSTGFTAHAWLEGDPPCHSEGFYELTRRPARG
jgi:Transglutaminase-like superfamily